MSNLIVAISGSLREASLNTELLRIAKARAPEGVEVEIVSIGDLPLYNGDLREEGGFPAPVERLGAAIREAGAVLIATPEYNYSFSGVLKNAIDWVSRLPDQPFARKPVAIMGATPGRYGTARAQYHLRQVFVYLDAIVLNRPEVLVAGARRGEDGALTDEFAKELIGQLVAALADEARDRALLSAAKGDAAG